MKWLRFACHQEPITPQNRCKKTQLAPSEVAINKKVCITCDPGSLPGMTTLSTYKHINCELLSVYFICDINYNVFNAGTSDFCSYMDVWQFKKVCVNSLLLIKINGDKLALSGLKLNLYFPVLLFFFLTDVLL